MIPFQSLDVVIFVVLQLNTSFTGCGQPGQDAVVILQKPDGICPAGTFNANANSRSDCLDCFCFGITDECTSTELFLNKVRPIFKIQILIFYSNIEQVYIIV